MSWKLKITDQWESKMRFAVRGILFINVILLSLTSVYLTARFLGHLIALLNRTLYARPW